MNIPNLENIIQIYKHQSHKKAITDYQLKGINAKVFNGIDRKNVFKFKNHMTKAQLFVFEIIGGHYLKKYNYQLFYGKAYILFSPFSLLLLSIFRVVNNARYSLRENKIYKKSLEMKSI